MGFRAVHVVYRPVLDRLALRDSAPGGLGTLYFVVSRDFSNGLSSSNFANGESRFTLGLRCSGGGGRGRALSALTGSAARLSSFLEPLDESRRQEGRRASRAGSAGGPWAPPDGF
jgi:hypothetical protein